MVVPNLSNLPLIRAVLADCNNTHKIIDDTNNDTLSLRYILDFFVRLTMPLIHNLLKATQVFYFLIQLTLFADHNLLVGLSLYVWHDILSEWDESKIILWSYFDELNNMRALILTMLKWNWKVATIQRYSCVRHMMEKYGYILLLLSFVSKYVNTASIHSSL